MKPTFSLFCAGLALSAAGFSVAEAAPATVPPKTTASKPTATSPFSKPLQGDKRFSQLLNRLTFGARPGDLEIAKRMGFKEWIESQLTPEKLDDSQLETQLKDLTWLQAKPEQLALAYESDTANFLKRMKQAQAGEIAMPVLTDRQQETKARIDAANLPPRSSIMALGELTTNKLARAIDSKRQLQEVLVDFWSNHFNVDVKKGLVRAFKIGDDRDVARTHAFSTFRELLGASAHSPAMLIYLDNARSTADQLHKRPRANVNNAKKRGGINENYARELMELHTLGVDGGYTQKDVTEVARCFTGWSVEPQTGEFIYRPFTHDQGEKVVLGQIISAGGGQQDGEKVLDILANSPATAHFIARKLCVRFVADNPPETLVKRVAAEFLRTKGDLKSTYRAIFYSPEFLSEGAYRSKIKSPFEFTVSAVRALNGTFEVVSQRPQARLIAAGGASLNNRNQTLKKLNKRPLALEISAMGEPLYSCQPPTGYSEDSTKWVSTSALVARLNFALTLTAGKVEDVVLGNDVFRNATVDDLSKGLLGADITPSTKATVEDEAAKAPGDGVQLRALLLGSPEFQRR